VIALSIILIILMTGAVGSLIFGLFLMARGGSETSAAESGRRQNKMMVYRIWFQALAILVLLLFFYITKK
jgi:hypothetical protein